MRRHLLITLALCSACADPDPADPTKPGGTDTETGTGTGTETDPPTVPPPLDHVAINEVSASNQLALLDANGDTPDWIELVNATDAPVDLAGWTLTDDPEEPAKWTFPPVTLAPGELLLVLAAGDGEPAPATAGVELRASFQLDADGEPVELRDAAGEVVDAIAPGPTGPDQSYGRPLSGIEWGYFLEPTPGAPNTTEARAGFAHAPLLSPPSGYYPGGVNVSLTAPQGLEIRYTQDGRTPADTDPLATGTLALQPGASDAAIVTASAFSPDLWPSPPVTATYLLRDVGAHPVISLVTDPALLFDEDIGIYAFGSDYESELPYMGANFWEDWEIPVHAQMWETDGTSAFEVDGTLSIHGGWTRAFEQKSLDLKMNLAGGDDAIEAQLFPELPTASWDQILLRNGGNDWYGCFIGGCSEGLQLRDALLQAMVAGQDIDRMAYRPAEVYIDGTWWGLYDLREKPDDSYILHHYGIEDIEIMDLGEAIEGDGVSWYVLLDYLRDNDLSDPAVWAQVEAQIDVHELATWLATEVFADNSDWPGNNVKWWRPAAEGGRWRWFLYDTDFGLGAYHADPANDTLAVALAPDGAGWPNPPEATEPFRLLMGSAQFRQIFASRYADLLNTAFDPSSTLPLREAMADRIADQIPRQEDRWGNWVGPSDVNKMDPKAYGDELELLDEWLELRPAYARQHVVENLGLAGTWELSLDAQPAGGGTFTLTAVTVGDGFTGTYFQGIPVTVTAVPAPGYTFVGWTGVDGAPTDATITLDSAGEAMGLVAHFE